MRKALSFLFVSVCLMCAAVGVWASCTMTYDPSSPDVITGSCTGSAIQTQTLTKTSSWALYMANGGPIVPEYSFVGFQTSGTGQCKTSEINQAACWPDFFQPTVFYPDGTGTAVFEQRVKSYVVVSTPDAQGRPFLNCETRLDNFWEKPLNCPPPPVEAGACNGPADYTLYPSTGCQSGFINSGGTCTRSAQFQNRCAEPSGYDYATCTCPDGIDTSPIVIDVDGTGFSMSGAFGGVVFNILNDGVPLPISWTAPLSSNAFLALDRNGNGLIDGGAELFGNLTPQTSTAKPNGFLALAEYDKAQNGGNGDGIIDRRDAIFSELRLWQDSNHNGLSEPNELKPASELISRIDLDYRESKRVDEYGNEFRYRSKVYNVNGVHGGRWAWDVFLKAQ
jgi:hypothetical protein